MSRENLSKQLCLYLIYERNYMRSIFFYFFYMTFGEDSYCISSQWLSCRVARIVAWQGMPAVKLTCAWVKYFPLQFSFNARRWAHDPVLSLYILDSIANHVKKNTKFIWHFLHVQNAVPHYLIIVLEYNRLIYIIIKFVFRFKFVFSNQHRISIYIKISNFF